jgi:hypothetical protein
MQHDSLFGHLVTTFHAHPENIATEALTYVLGRSPTAAKAVIRLVSQFGIALSDPLMFRSQHIGPDTAIPDLVGLDGNGHHILIVEAKFWAGLTEHQPNTYLKRLPTDRHAALMFVAPSLRFPTLWPELLRRCETARVGLLKTTLLTDEIYFTFVTVNHVLALVSWRALLGFIRIALESNGALDHAADLNQFEGLCNRMDADAFLPLRSDELTSNVGARIVQYCQIVDRVTDLAVSAELAVVAGLRAAGGAAWYGRYMKIHGCGCLLHFNGHHWARRRSTPLWLSVKDQDWKVPPGLRMALAPLEIADPPHLLVGDNELLVPIFLPP